MSIGGIGSTPSFSGMESTGSGSGEHKISDNLPKETTTAGETTPMEGLSADLTHVPKDAVISNDPPSGTSTVAERMDSEAKLDSDGDGHTDNIDNDDYNGHVDNNLHG